MIRLEAGMVMWMVVWADGGPTDFVRVKILDDLIYCKLDNGRVEIVQRQNLYETAVEAAKVVAEHLECHSRILSKRAKQIRERAEAEELGSRISSAAEAAFDELGEKFRSIIEESKGVRDAVG